MRRTERHHLKENELAHSVARARELVATRRQPIVAAVVIGVLLIAAGTAYAIWRSSREAKAGAMFAAAAAVIDAPVVPPAPPAAPGPDGKPAPPPPAPAAGSYPTETAKLEAALPKLVAVADAYPKTGAGLEARYRAAATLAALGRFEEAGQRYREVVDRAGRGVYGRVARLGLADVQLRARKFDEAITLFKGVADEANKDLPADAILMQLARAYQAAGRATEARQTFNRVATEFPTSAYATDAKREVEVIDAAKKG